MPSQWYHKASDGERGPLSFAEMAAMLRAGTLHEHDLVRREGQSQWQHAEDVVGLLRAAGRRAEQPAAPPSDGGGRTTCSPQERTPKKSPVARDEERGAAVDSPAQSSGGAWSANVGLRGILGSFLGLAVIIGVFIGAWYWHVEATRFPMPAGLRPPPVTERFFFGWGPLSLFEYILVWIDAIVVAGFLVYVFIGRIWRKRPRRGRT
jgi:hypothetical protein